MKGPSVHWFFENIRLYVKYMNFLTIIKGLYIEQNTGVFKKIGFVQNISRVRPQIVVTYKSYESPRTIFRYTITYF